MRGPTNPKRLCLIFIILGGLLQISGCVKSGSSIPEDLSAAEYRQQAYHSISEKRYADGIKLLQKAIDLEPNGEDYLLLGDVWEGLQQYRPARSSYQKGLEANPDDKSRRAFVFHWASLELLEFKNPEKAAELTRQLPNNSAEALNLQALQKLGENRFDAVLRLTEQVTRNSADQEMKGWAYYQAARAWIAFNKQSKAFQSLFFAINHARGHGLVGRITRLWEELKQQPLQQ